MHPCEEKKDGCREFLTLPRIWGCRCHWWGIQEFSIEGTPTLFKKSSGAWVPTQSQKPCLYKNWGARPYSAKIRGGMRRGHPPLNPPPTEWVTKSAFERLTIWCYTYICLPFGVPLLRNFGKSMVGFHRKQEHQNQVGCIFGSSVLKSTPIRKKFMLY